MIPEGTVLDWGALYLQQELGYETKDVWIPDVFGYAASLPQIKAARPTLDYDGIYGSPDRFIDAVYQSLATSKK